MEGVATGIGRCSIVAKVALEPAQRIYIYMLVFVVDATCLIIVTTASTWTHRSAPVGARLSAARVGLRRDEKYI